MTHFASADEPTLNEFTKTQVSRYEAVLQQFEAQGIRPSFHDLCNSAATVSHPFAYGNMVRPGGILYGLWRDILQPSVSGEAFQNVMSVYSNIALLKRVPKGDSLGYGCTFRTTRDSLIATLPIGYHDGFVRANSNRGRVIIRGHYAPVVGRVSMDLTIVDVTDVPGVRLDDRAIIIGQDGELSIHAEEMAKLADTISYEITCGISGRVPRVYV
jgi:alanine racemase